MPAGDNAMDIIFWIGLFLGGLLGLIGSILGNLWTDAVHDFLDKRRRIRLSNKKSKEVRTYFFVRALREGDPTAKVLFDMDATFSNRAAIFTGICLGAMMCLILVAFHPNAHEYPIAIVTVLFVLTVFMVAIHLWSTTLHWKLLQIRRRLMWFHEYETGIRAKWGDDELEEMQMAAEQHQRDFERIAPN
jgi:hypothetical protein